MEKSIALVKKRDELKDIGHSITITGNGDAQENMKQFLGIVKGEGNEARMQNFTTEEDGATTLRVCFCCDFSAQKTYWRDCNGGLCWFNNNGCIS